MRVVFAGTPEFAVPALEALVQGGHRVELVLTQPDRPAGRGMRLTPSPVSLAASRLGLPVAAPLTLRTPEALQHLRTVAPEVMVVAAYGLILPQAALDIPSRGCLNIHASLLPRWRGAAPVHRAILAGDATTGVSIMCMEAGLDTGPVLLTRALEIAPGDTTGSLTEKLARLGAAGILEALTEIDRLVRKPQDPAMATYAAKVGKADAVIDWSHSAEQIARQVRAFNPAPGAEADLGGVKLKVWEAIAVSRSQLSPGQIGGAAGELLVGCGTGALRALLIQRAGARRMGVEEFLRGKPWASKSLGESSS